MTLHADDDVTPTIDLDLCRRALAFLEVRHGCRRVEPPFSLEDPYRWVVPLVYRCPRVEVRVLATDREREMFLIVAPRLMGLTLRPLAVDVDVLIQMAGDDVAASPPGLSDEARHARLARRADFLREHFAHLPLWAGLRRQFAVTLTGRPLPRAPRVRR